MNLEKLQAYIFPLIMIIFFSYRIINFKMIKKKIPSMLEEGALLIDVRSVSEYQTAHNPASVNVPLDQLSKESAKFDKSKMILLCCASGTRSAIAVNILRKNDFKNILNIGSWTNSLN